jgi:hypothetical protein
MNGQRVGALLRACAGWLNRCLAEALESDLCMYVLAAVVCAVRAWHFVSARDLDDPVAIMLDLAGVGGLVVGCAKLAREQRREQAPRR